MTDDVEVDSLLLVGRIWRAHGLRGEVKVIPESDDTERFEDLPVLYTGTTANTARSRTVQSVRYQHSKKGTLVILKLEGVDSRDEAESLKKSLVYARPDDVPPLQEDEYFLHDLIGLQAVREDGSAIGVVDNVLELPGQELLVIAREDRPSALVPAVPEFVVDIDVDAGRLVIRPIEGLLEE